MTAEPATSFPTWLEKSAALKAALLAVLKTYDARIEYDQWEDSYWIAGKDIYLSLADLKTPTKVR